MAPSHHVRAELHVLPSVTLTSFPFKERGKSTFTCIGLSLESRMDKWRRLHASVAAHAAGSCRSPFWRAGAIAPGDKRLDAARNAVSQRHYDHFVPP